MLYILCFLFFFYYYYFHYITHKQQVAADLGLTKHPTLLLSFQKQQCDDEDDDNNDDDGGEAEAEPKLIWRSIDQQHTAPFSSSSLSSLCKEWDLAVSGRAMGCVKEEDLRQVRFYVVYVYICVYVCMLGMFVFSLIHTHTSWYLMCVSGRESLPNKSNR